MTLISPFTEVSVVIPRPDTEVVSNKFVVEFQNISKEYKAFYTEGMTVWSEIQYLKFLYNDNPDPIYLAIIESQSHREDIYGEGYRQVIKDMEKYNYDDVFKFAHDAFIKKIIELDELK